MVTLITPNIVAYPVYDIKHSVLLSLLQRTNSEDSAYCTIDSPSSGSINPNSPSTLTPHRPTNSPSTLTPHRPGIRPNSLPTDTPHRPDVQQQENVTGQVTSNEHGGEGEGAATEKDDSKKVRHSAHTTIIHYNNRRKLLWSCRDLPVILFGWLIVILCERGLAPYITVRSVCAVFHWQAIST